MPPSHLTRNVLRRILANEPIVHRGCLRRQADHSSRSSTRTTTTTTTTSRSCIPHNGRNGPSHVQRRTFFDLNMFGSKKRQVREADIDPGIEEMMHLAKMQRMKARLPPVAVVATALHDFFHQKRKSRGVLSDTHARLATQSFQYCFDAEPERTRSRRASNGAISNSLVVFALQKLLSRDGTPIANDAHRQLAQLLYEKTRSASIKARFIGARAYIRILGMTGQAIKARELVQSIETLELGPNRPSAQDEDVNGDATASDVLRTNDDDTKSRLATCWLEALRAMANEASESELLATLQSIRARDWIDATDWKVAEPMIAFYLRTSNAKAVELWWRQYWQSFSDAEQQTAIDEAKVAEDLQAVLRWCLSRQQLELGHQIVRQVMTNNPPKLFWDAIFIWAAGTGKGADEIGRMLDVMEASNEDIPDPVEWRTPDIATINGLVEYATIKQDPYLAERFITLGKSRQIEPDAKTYQLQMQYRLTINDVDGALIAYKNLQAMDLSSNQDVPTVNKLIVALCQSKRHDFDTVMNVTMDLADRRARFDPPTVTALTLLHLNRDETNDVIDLLNTHSHHYSSGEREEIRTTVLGFCLDPATPTSRAWDAYKVLGTVFDEMPRSERTAIMTSFYTRERPDMAVFIFNEMRRHSRPDTIATIDTYVASFLGSAKLRDLDSLEVIHNQLKLDYNIDSNTYLVNALMLSYTACDQPRQALGFWEDIVASKEGPTYNSIHIALRACEKAPFGDLRAKELWAKLRRMNVDLDQSMWASYAAALAGNGDNKLALSTIGAAEEKSEVEIDAFLLGSLLDGAAGVEKQEEVEQWARDRYPHVWEEVEKLGFEISEESGKRIPKIDRSVTP
ncbi:Putative tetratricopeptide-like helical domain superfamily [Septoria linicola]|uniref:Tetratricopeptide-like helical domain superfamily n=1 Tax=Septoria linicola TaxID=215465 RepID=A0A9Q9B1F4_9PEZI|nr:putative tetratricopeptide-like helical domain superfamily [Septoria linicola]USW55813.1 Putative tetratricopeptide-like helical domain superfamily [Septoria linicola]